MLLCVDVVVDILLEFSDLRRDSEAFAEFLVGDLQCERDAVVVDAVGFSCDLRVEKVNFVTNLLDFCSDVFGPASLKDVRQTSAAEHLACHPRVVDM